MPAEAEPAGGGSDLVAEGLRAALGFLGDRLREHEPMGPLCTYRVGGPARWFAEVDDLAELQRLAGALAELDPAARPPLLVVGRGSNLLVADRGFGGLALRLGPEFERIEAGGRGRGSRGDGGAGADGGGAGDTRLVTVGAAASLPVVARRTVAMGLTGFEWAVGVPGTIGGAVRMNAGGHGADMARNLVGIRVVDLATGETEEMDAAALGLGYRRSRLRTHQVVVDAELRLSRGSVERSEAELSEIVRWRRAHQPGGSNAGSVFTNPPGDSAGRLIDAAGCKGLRVGSAEVSTKHANFIQADPGGSADDVAALMALVQERVERVTGVRLHPETVLVGFEDGAPA